MLVRDPTVLRQVIDDSGLPFAEIAARAQVDPSFISHLAPPRIAPPRPGEAPCPFRWSPVSACAGVAGHEGRHAASSRPRRHSCAPPTAVRIANALGRTVEALFEVRGRDDPSTGPLPVQTHTRTPATPIGGRHRMAEQ